MLATSYLAIPEEFTVEKVSAYISERPPNAGETVISTSGYDITIANDVNSIAFYNYILTQFRKINL